MSGLTDLNQLIRDLSPILNPGEWVFVSLQDSSIAGSLESICTFVESEGITAICPRDRADRAGLPYDGVFGHITLKVHSSLHAVGLIAAVAEVLKRAGIPCNVISAFHHDHLFIPIERAKDAHQLLVALAAGQ